MLQRHERWVLMLPLLLVILPFLILPAASGLFYSFTNYAPGQMHLHWLGATNYTALINDPTYQSAWRNSFVFTILSVPAEIAIGFGLAYLLREPFPGRGLMRVILLLPWLVSPVANGVMWYFLLNLQIGIPNFARAWLRLATQPSPLGSTHLALLVAVATSVWRNAPLAGFLLLPGLLAIPAAHWEYGTLEGATVFNLVRQVALPALRPLLLAVTLLLVGDALGAFDTLLILTGGGPGSATMTPALFSYQQAFQFNEWPLGAAAAWLIILSILLIGGAYLKLVRPEAGR